MNTEPFLIETRRQIRRARIGGATIACVPTMGALHAGHVSLIERAARECEFVVVTIFVNPTQFGPSEDFGKYPRTLEADLQLCRNAGASLVFTPETSAMYCPMAQTIVRVTELSSVLEGAHRPGHFDGVSTVVTKLFHITEPDRAYFGQKDYQQQLIIRRMVQDLDLPVEIVTCPIVREADGLAMSSRNRYLNEDERRTAAQLFQTLQAAAQDAHDPALQPPEIAQRMQVRIRSVPGIDLQYAVVADEETLQPLQHRRQSGIALIAAKVGSTRLIDNMQLLFR